ncbi:hypothetical protein ACLB1Q_17255 [Escherichia coli]
MAHYAEINNFPPELSSGGDKYFHLRNYSEYSEYTSGFFLSLMIFIKIMTFFLKSQ